MIATGVLLQTSPMAVMGFSEKNIKTPADIKGKTIVLTPGDSMSQVWPLMMQKTGRRTVPQIYIGETHVGGFDDLFALDQAGGLDPLLQRT